MPSLFRTRIPLPTSVSSTAVKVSAGRSASVSFASTLVSVVSSAVTTPPSATVAVSAAAVGASLTALTVIVTVAIIESRTPSLILYVKLSDPLKFRFGV